MSRLCQCFHINWFGYGWQIVRVHYYVPVNRPPLTWWILQPFSFLCFQYSAVWWTIEFICSRWLRQAQVSASCLSTVLSSMLIANRYQQLLGCSKLNLSNTSALYARYTTSVICNGIVQSSKAPCGLSDQNARPLCAESCVRSLPSWSLASVIGSYWYMTGSIGYERRNDRRKSWRMWHTSESFHGPDSGRLYGVCSSSRLLNRSLYRGRAEWAKWMWFRAESIRSLRILCRQLP